MLNNDIQHYLPLLREKKRFKPILNTEKRLLFLNFQPA